MKAKLKAISPVLLILILILISAALVFVDPAFALLPYAIVMLWLFYFISKPRLKKLGLKEFARQGAMDWIFTSIIIFIFMLLFVIIMGRGLF